MCFCICIDFKPFRECYYFLYQSFDCYANNCISTVMQNYCIPLQIQRQMYSNRLVNQSLLNFLLIHLRKDKDHSKFYKIIVSLIKDTVLKERAKEILDNCK